jgi:hypothetical protein
MIFMSSLVAEPVEVTILNRNGARNCFPQISQLLADRLIAMAQVFLTDDTDVHSEVFP